MFPGSRAGTLWAGGEPEQPGRGLCKKSGKDMAALTRELVMDTERHEWIQERDKGSNH